MEKPNLKIRSHFIESFISATGGTVCLMITYYIWSSLVSSQQIWLLPGLYFLELMAGAVICTLAYFKGLPQVATFAWIYNVILAVFILLAGFSVGFFYIPVFLIFVGLSIYSLIRQKLDFLPKLGIFVGAGLVQFLLMMLFVSIS
jgi:hypothetical protein